MTAATRVRAHLTADDCRGGACGPDSTCAWHRLPVADFEAALAEARRQGAAELARDALKRSGEACKCRRFSWHIAALKALLPGGEACEHGYTQPAYCHTCTAAKVRAEPAQHHKPTCALLTHGDDWPCCDCGGSP